MSCPRSAVPLGNVACEEPARFQPARFRPQRFPWTLPKRKRPLSQETLSCFRDNMAAAGVNMALTIPYVSRLNDLQYIAGRRDDPTKTIRDGLITLKAGNPVFNLYTAKAATRDFGLYHLGATHAVVVFRGTDLGNGVPQILRDALHDAQLFFNSVPTRTEAARLFITQNWAHWTNGRTLVFVGHSLGGRIAAELTAHFPNSSAHIFNPAYPIHDGRPPAPHLQRVVAYCIKGDWVWQSFNGPHRFVIPVTQKDKHALSNFIR